MLPVILDYDKAAYLWCVRFQKSQPITSFFKAVSHSGDGYLYAAIALFIYLHNSLADELFLIAALSAFLVELPAFIILKKIIKRDRPFVNLEGSSCAITPSDKFSLPSGHTAAAFLMATIISNFYPALSPLVYFWASLIGTSRVMLGVHYPTDIIAGAALGIFCAALSLSIFL